MHVQHLSILHQVFFVTISLCRMMMAGVQCSQTALPLTRSQAMVRASRPPTTLQTGCCERPTSAAIQTSCASQGLARRGRRRSRLGHCMRWVRGRSGEGMAGAAPLWQNGCMSSFVCLFGDNYSLAFCWTVDSAVFGLLTMFLHPLLLIFGRP